MSYVPFASQVAIVTGGSKGLGRSIALKLASLGANVGIVYNSSAESAHEVVKGIEAFGVSGKAFKGDLSRLDQVRAVFAQIKEAYPQGIDVSILNAGITGVYPIEIAEEAEFDSIFNTNVKGTVFAAQESIKQLKDGGKLLFMSTAGTHATFPGLAFYNASKAAVDQFVRVLAVELGPRKISVNSIAPSTIETDLLPQAFREWGANASVFKRIGHPEDVALAVVGVLQAPWITGAVVPVTGGSIIF